MLPQPPLPRLRSWLVCSAGSCGVSLDAGQGAQGTALLCLPGPHPALVIKVITSEPVRASGRFAVFGFARKKLQTDHAHSDGLGVSIGKSGNASPDMSPHRPLGVAIVI